jgi:serine/threonine protein kinase
MLTRTGARVVDFGISALIGENDIDPDGSLLGTPAYLAPERLEGGQVSPATDVNIAVSTAKTRTGTDAGSGPVCGQVGTAIAPDSSRTSSNIQCGLSGRPNRPYS